MDKKIVVIIIVSVAFLFLCALCSVGGFIYYSNAILVDTMEGSDLIEPLESDDYQPVPSDDNPAGSDVCDNSADDFQAVYRNQSLTVIQNPCEVIWLLAQAEESYTLTSAGGDTIYVTVWRDWDDNVTPGDTFTIRALDVEDSEFGFEEGRNDSTILITRWVAAEGDLTEAKEEVNEFVRNMR